ncbi:two-component sensor histidine kinase [Fulvitalea axinellae]|uniref:histidine kinase n=1 Tax=Fulvitalea axinellae TaxID=1182444 RepID=A0AAU9CX63_9BACT|nr:two-component sensor histidine kinase [Fulvitalea axinellae]
MLFSSKRVAALLSLSICLVTTAFLSLMDVTTSALVVTLFISFGVSYLLISITFEFLIFKDVNRIYEMLDDLRKNDFSFIKKVSGKSRNPIKRVNEEIYNYASVKQREIDELKRMEAYRREFLADVSHELKTPIFAAQGFIHTLLDGALEDPEVSRKFLGKSAKSLDGLAKLVQNLLSISRMESGDLAMHFEDFDIRQLASDVFDQFEHKAEKKNIQLVMAENSPKEVYVFADRQRISQVLVNLVSNAMKYTETPAKVEIGFEIDDEVAVYVKDSGMGIPPEDIDRIFERFYRVEKSRAKDLGGTGLGLAIVRHILQAHGHSVHVESQVGKGSTFKFRLRKGENMVLERL